MFFGSYLLFGSAGPAFPESYAHADGGAYRGEWRGMAKEGLGAYRYPSGAAYEGEWRANLKDGRGVYYYPKVRPARYGARMFATDLALGLAGVCGSTSDARLVSQGLCLEPERGGGRSLETPFAAGLVGGTTHGGPSQAR